VATTDLRRETWTAAALSSAVLVAGFAFLHDQPILLPHQGLHSVLAADSLMAGDGLFVSANLPFAKFGPLYPMLLALLGRLGLGPTEAAYLINCGAFAATLLGIFLLGRALRLDGVRWIVLAFTLWAPNYHLIRAARPDPIVIALSLFALYGMATWTRRPSYGSLLAAGIACALAASTRYMALLTLVPVFALAVWIAPGLTWRRRLRDLAAYGFVATAPVVLWMGRNLHVTGFITGRSRTESRDFADHYDFLGNLWGLLETVAIDAFAIGAVGIRAVVYDKQPLDAPALVLTSLVIALLAFGASVWLGRRALADSLREAFPVRSRCGAAFVLSTAYAFLYASMLVLVWTFSNNDPIDTRYVAPLYPFLFLGVGGALEIATRGTGRGKVAAAAILIALLVVAPNAWKTVRLLGSEPGPTLLPVSVVGSRGSNWVAPTSWTEIRRRSAPAVDRRR
jgi:4-amino-4-deoxy-L-arabinose transferase-like glycosyltransferase